MSNQVLDNCLPSYGAADRLQSIHGSLGSNVRWIMTVRSQKMVDDWVRYGQKSQN